MAVIDVIALVSSYNPLRVYFNALFCPFLPSNKTDFINTERFSKHFFNWLTDLFHTLFMFYIFFCREDFQNKVEATQGLPWRIKAV